MRSRAVLSFPCAGSSTKPLSANPMSALCGFEDIADSAHGLEIARLRRIVFELAAQAVDELLQHLAVAGAAAAPDVDGEALGGEGVAGIGDQQLEQTPLQRGETDRIAAADTHPAPLGVQHEIAGVQSGLAPFGDAPQQSPDPGEQ